MNVILKNFLSLALGRYFAMGIGAVVVVLLGRALGVEDYGRFFGILAACELFGAVLDLGLNRILLKEGAADRDRTGAHLFNILLIKAALVVLLLVGMHFYAQRLGSLYTLAMLLVLCKAADGFTLTFDAVFQIFQRMEFSALILVAARIALLVAVLAGWLSESGLLYFGWTYFLVSLGSALATVLVSGLRFTRPRRGDVLLMQTVGREGLFFAISSLLYMVGTRLDMVMLREWVDATTLGLYTPAARILLVFQVLPLVLQTSVLPELFRLGRHDRQGLRGFYSAYLHRSLLLVQFPLFWALFYADGIIGGLWGEAFLPGARWLPLLIWVLLLRFVSLAAGNVLTALDRQWERSIWAASGVGTSFALMIWLLPEHGVSGCITALLVGEALMAGLNLAAAARLGYRPAGLPLLRTLAAAALAAVLLGLAARFLPGGFLMGLVLTALIVSASMLATGAARWRELSHILQTSRSR